MPLQFLAFISGKSNPRTWKRSVREVTLLAVLSAVDGAGEVAAADGRDMQPQRVWRLEHCF